MTRCFNKPWKKVMATNATFMLLTYFFLPNRLVTCIRDVLVVTLAAVPVPHRQTHVFHVASCMLHLVSNTVSILAPFYD